VQHDSVSIPLIGRAVRSLVESLPRRAGPSSTHQARRSASAFAEHIDLSAQRCPDARRPNGSKEKPFQAVDLEGLSWLRG
jgi:hypothetical protein